MTDTRTFAQSGAASVLIQEPQDVCPAVSFLHEAASEESATKTRVWTHCACSTRTFEGSGAASRKEQPGQIVGELIIDIESPDPDESRAFVWLPLADYGLSAGMYLLDDLPETQVSQLNGSIAFDINDDGLVVARCTTGISPAFVDHPTAWNLNSMDYFFIDDIDEAVEGTTALAINNDDPAIIMLGVEINFETVGDPGSFEPGPGFSFEIDAEGAEPMVVTGGSPHDGFAFGLSDTVGGDMIAAGVMTCNPASPYECTSALCLGRNDGVYWTDILDTGLELPAIDDLPENVNSALVVGHAVSNDLYIVGFGHDPESSSPTCRHFMLFYDDPTQDSTVLPLLQGFPNDSERGFDIREQTNGIIDIVGRSVTEGLALLC